MGSDYRIALLCNAYSTNTEFFNRPMQALVDTILGSQKGPQQTPVPPLLNNAALANGPTTPLSMFILDSLTVHSKMSLIHAIVTHVIKLAQAKSNMALSLAPALVETYSRLLVYTEIESLGIKGFISKNSFTPTFLYQSSCRVCGRVGTKRVYIVLWLTYLPNL